MSMELSFEEALEFAFRPGVAEAIGVVFACVASCLFVLLGVVFIFVLAYSLVRRFIWPGKKKTEEKEAP